MISNYEKSIQWKKQQNDNFHNGKNPQAVQVTNIQHIQELLKVSYNP